MKKIYLFLGAVILTASTEAQQLKPANGSAKLLKTMTMSESNNAAKVAAPQAGDTVAWSNFTDFLPEFSPSGNLSIYGYTGGGYVYGKNHDSLNVCGAGFFNVGAVPVTITKAVIWAAKKSHSGTATSSNLTVRMWDMAANKAYSYNGTAWNQDKYGPNTVKTATTVPYSMIDTSSTLPTSPWTIVTFSAPVTFTADFAIELNTVTLAAGDTVGFVSDKAGDQGGVQMTFHKSWYGGTSYSPWVITDGGFFAAGSLDNSIAAFPILASNVAVKEYFNGVKLNDIYPNPASDVATLEYSFEKESNNVSVIVYDIRGTKVFEEKQGTLAAGSHKITLNTEAFSAGSYFYQVRANGYVLTKEFIISK
jgi:hypothetical protein